MTRAHLAALAPLVALVGSAAALSATASCVGTTGSGIIAFTAAAAGPSAITTKGHYEFDNAFGYHVALTKAQVYVGAVYLRRDRPVGLARPTSCVVPGAYVAQITSPLQVDALDPTPQAFPEAGAGVIDHALTAEVWLTGVPIDAETDSTAVLQVAGSATKAGTTIPFDGTLTISKNRIIPPDNPATPGATPLCQQRIVSPIAVDFETSAGGALLVRLDPAAFFRAVDFAQLSAPSTTTSTPAGDAGTADGSVAATRHFLDANEGQPALNLFNGLRAVSGAYDFTWNP